MIRLLPSLAFPVVGSSRWYSLALLGALALGSSACTQQARAPEAAPAEDAPALDPSGLVPATFEPEPAPAEAAAPAADGEGFGSSGPSDRGRRNRSQLRSGKVTIDGEYDAELPFRIMRQNFARFRMCFEQSSLEEARATFAFTIRTDGGVEQVKVSFDVAAQPETSACLERAASGLSFPPPKAVVKVSAPVMYLADGDRPKAPEAVARFSESVPDALAVAHDAKLDRYLIVKAAGEAKPASVLALQPEGSGPVATFLADGSTSKAGAKVSLGELGASLVVGDVLYVGDGGTVRAFSLTSGEPKAPTLLEGAAVVVGLVPLPDGRVLAVAHDGRLAGSHGGEAEDERLLLYVLDGKGKATLLGKGAYGSITSGAVVERTLWLGTSDGELFKLNEKYERVWIMHPFPAGVMHVSAVPGGVLIVGSDSVYGTLTAVTGPVGGPYRTVIEGVPAALTATWDSKRSRLVVLDAATRTVSAYAVSLTPGK